MRTENLNLITGGSGFIGAALARKLVERGEKIRILDIIPPDSYLRDAGAEYLNTDIRDRNRVMEACEGVDKIHHIVSLVPISKAAGEFWEVNVEGTRNVLEGALRHGVRKVIHMSSSAVYDLDQRSPMTEQSLLKPIGVYGSSKYDGEKVCHEYRNRGLDITIVRPRTVIGPGRLGIFAILFDWVRRGKNIYIIGSGDNKIQFIHVDELVEAWVLMADRTGSEVFNIGTDRFGTLREDLSALIKYAGTSSKVVSLNQTLAIGTLKFLDKLNLSPLADWHYLTYHKDFYFDISKAENVLGWSPTYSNAEMLIESYQWYRRNYPALERQLGTTHRKSVRQRLLKLIRSFS